MLEALKGKVFIMGNNVNTDVIIPGEYLHHTEPKELAKYGFSVMGPDYVQRLRKSDFIVAGENFGCGSSREQATVVIKEMGIKAVIARSFARIFYRNAINTGLPVIESHDLCDMVKEGDEIFIDYGKCEISTPQKIFRFQGFPKNIQGILDAGGLLEYLKAHPVK